MVRSPRERAKQKSSEKTKPKEKPKDSEETLHLILGSKGIIIATTTIQGEESDTKATIVEVPFNQTVTIWTNLDVVINPLPKEGNAAALLVLVE